MLQPSFSWQKLTYSRDLVKLVTILDKAELICFNDPSDSVRLCYTQKNVFRWSGTCLHIGRYALNSLGCICTNLLQLRGLSENFRESMMFVKEPLEDVYHIKQWLQLWSSKFNSSRMSLVLGLKSVHYALLSHFEGVGPAHSPSLFCGIFCKKGRKMSGGCPWLFHFKVFGLLFCSTVFSNRDDLDEFMKISPMPGPNLNFVKCSTVWFGFFKEPLT